MVTKMALQDLLLLSLITCFVTHVASYDGGKVMEETVSYVGAVIEYEPYNIWSEEGQGYEVLKINIEAISSAARTAKYQQADILVTPEYGLTSLWTSSENFTNFFTYTTYVPDPSNFVVPCDSLETNPNVEGLKLLSCTAKEESMYLAVNLLEVHPCSTETIASAPWFEYSTYEEDANCPESGFYFHNTETVLDRTGAVIARYRKIHLFNEDGLTPGPVDDTTALFVTDFNVQFSLQICFDIGFEDPAYNNVKNQGIKDVISSTAWVDYLPFNTADLTQDGWSRGLKANLLISGYHLPEEAKMGSGIYRQLFDEPPVYVYDKDSGNVLLIAKVKTTIETTEIQKHEKSKEDKRVQDKIIYLNTEKEDRVHAVFHERLDDYSSSSLLSSPLGEVFSVKVCSVDEFCCNLKYEYTGNLTYKLIALKGQFVVGGRYHIGVQNCAVLWCKSHNINSCGVIDRSGLEDEFGPFTLSSSSFTIDSVFPGGGHRNMSLVGHDILQFFVEGSNYSLSSNQPIKDFFGASLFGRWFANDGTSQ